jgi:oligopeptide transport system ATP-binding protein
MSPLLEVRDLETRFFTQDGIVKAVNGISFDLQPGETLGVVGESGCGKSVSMLSIIGLIPNPPGKVTRGQAHFHGEDLLKMPPGEMRQIRGSRIAMIFQDPMTSLHPVLPIGKQVGEALRYHQGIGKAQIREKVIELLADVGIPSPEDRVDDFPHQFSGGMRQRVMIAMALSCDPEILIADEPTTALDVTVQAQIVELVKRLREEHGMAVIWITHNLGVVAELADRINVMYAGCIVETAAVDDLFYNPRHPYTTLLLKSVPRLDAEERERLQNIEGLPPDLLALPEGCPFAARCYRVQERCLTEMPSLREIEEGHAIACWSEGE